MYTNKRPQHYRKAVISLLIWTVIVTALFTCTENKNENEQPITKLRVSMLPDENKEKLLSRYTPLFDYISNETGFQYEFIIPDSYDNLVELFQEKKIDLAYFGGFTFLKAHISSSAVPLVMRDVDTRFYSYFIARGDSRAEKLSDFKGMRFSFGSALSTSGHLMPRYFMKKMGIIPETYFSDVSYSGKHDLTAYQIRDDLADLGVANHAVINSMYKDGRLTPKTVKVIWKTPPYPDYVWALRPVFSKSVQIKLRDAFLKLSKNNPQHVKILNGIDANYFLPASASDFTKLKETIHELKLLENQ